MTTKYRSIILIVALVLIGAQTSLGGGCHPCSCCGGACRSANRGACAQPASYGSGHDQRGN